MIKKLIDYFYYIIEIIFNYFPFFLNLYIKFHEFSVLEEIELSQISRYEKVLHIGCGAIPYTSIILARKTNAKIIGIDNKQNIVNAAINCVKRYNLSNKIKIELGDGMTFIVKGYDIVVISYGVSYPDLVLKHVINSMNQNTRIVLRKPIQKKDEYIDSIIKNFSVCSKQLLLTQESILIVK